MGALQQILSSYGGASGVPIALVQQKVGSAADGSSGITVTFDAPLAAGSSVIALLEPDPKLSVDPVLVGGGAGALALVLEQAGTTSLQIWVIHGVTGGETGLTFTSTAAVPVVANVSEWSGLANAGAEATNSTTGVSASPAIAVTPTSASNLCIAAYSTPTDDYASGPTGGFTRMTSASITGVFMETAYKIQAVVAVGAAEWSIDNPATNWTVVAAAFGGT